VGNSHLSIMVVLMTFIARVRNRVQVRVSISFCSTMCVSGLQGTFNDVDMDMDRCKFLIDS